MIVQLAGNRAPESILTAQLGRRMLLGGLGLAVLGGTSLIAAAAHAEDRNVPFRRPDGATQTLWNEVAARWGHQARNLGFVAGETNWFSGSNSGHNPDSNGITHAVDIGVDSAGNGAGIPVSDGISLAEFLLAVGRDTNRFQYLIHRRRIASQNSNWQWVDYAGTDSHFGHIHLSVCNQRWGEPAPISSSIYDSTASWGIKNGYTPDQQFLIDLFGSL